MIPFERDGADIVARFTSAEVELLRELASQVTELLSDRAGDSTGDVLLAQLGIGGASTPPRDPALARLLPDAYRDDADAASEHRRLTEASLVDRKIANAAALSESLGSGSVRLSPHVVQSWLRSLTDLRLVIAARLGIQHDDDDGWVTRSFRMSTTGWVIFRGACWSFWRTDGHHPGGRVRAARD